MAKSDQKYTVLFKQVGPYPQFNPDGTPFVFTESSFKDEHPATHLSTDEKKDEYHKGLIKRLLDLKAIQLAPSDSTVSDIPLGPEFDGVKNPAAPAPALPAAKDAPAAAK